MTESGESPSLQRLLDCLDDGATDEAVAQLDRLAGAETETRKTTLRALRDQATEQAPSFDSLGGPLAAFLTDDERAVRLTTAKLFVTLASETPSVARPAVGPLADRLADDEEFYYVRARCAEALGYVALDYPDAVSDPELLADLRVGLAFDEQEVKEKLAKALEYVALGDPDRLRHHVERLADHLDDESTLVRYHLTTVLVAVGSASPERLAGAAGPLADRLVDSNPYVRGRAAEAVGLCPSHDDETAETLRGLRESDEPFVAHRAAFAATGVAPVDDGATDEPLGTVESVRATTTDAVEAITTPESDGGCPHCGCSLPADGPPMCPQCGAPR